ncbi:YlbF family regulator [Leuconostocaceae bacterium ESL0723]|nr:YlbF family regulator [Lactobacillaceae bacterium L1_55_11]WEV55066.1 YlbF family regulator [Leuconostocaceae bacterium ESL0723]
MTVNIYDNANEMANVLTETDQYIAWQNAFGAVQDDQEAKDLFAQFQKIQATVQQLMQAQQTPKPEQEKEWDAVAKDVQSNELIKNLMTAEQNLNGLLGELNEIVTKPISQAYADAQ